MNTIEGKIGNNLIIVKPQEIQKAIAAAGKSKREQEQDDMEAEAQRQMMQRIEKAQEAPAAPVTQYQFADGKKGCNPATNICVLWEKADAPDMASRGKGIAFRKAGDEHYAEVKTQGYSSNTSLTIIQNDTVATEMIGDGSPGGNMVSIKQNMGVLKR
jgi:hypothetical protein